MLCNRYGFTIATRSLGEFGGATEAPASPAMLAEGATRKFAQGTAARRVELKMDRRRRCFSVAGRKGTCSLVAPWRRAILNSTIVKAYRLHNTGSSGCSREKCGVVSSYVRAVASAAAIQPSAAALEAGLMEQEQHYPYPVVALP